MRNDEWPWECLSCGTTLYHDVEHCRTCASASVHPKTRGRSSALREFVSWMRREPYPSFVLKVTAISSTELALTALWLHLILLGPSELIRNGILPV